MHKVILILIALLPLVIYAEDDLSGLMGIEYVVVMTGEDEYEDLLVGGISASLVQTQIELALRKAGITIKDSLDTILDDAGVLSISLDYICEDFGYDENIYTVHASLIFSQLSYVSRDLIDLLLYADENQNADISGIFFDNSTPVWAVTWQMYQMYYCGESSLYSMTTETLDRLVTYFANDYLKANQK